MADTQAGTSGDTRPVPDPTALTLDALQREIGQLRALLETTIEGINDVTNEKFGSVETQLDLIERQRVEQKKDTKDAVDAALAAAKEAVKEQTTASERSIAKSETATIKSIDQLGDKFDTAVEGLRRELGDLKERVTGGEGQRAGQGALVGYIFGGLGAIGVIAAIIALATR